jgi:PAS domain S-box-containing protein
VWRRREHFDSQQKAGEIIKLHTREMIGHPREKFMPAEIARQHRQNDLLVAKTRKSIIMEESNLEDDGMHYYLTQKFPIFDHEGNVEAIGGIATDFTDRKRAEEQLRLNEEKYRMLAENTSDWVYWMEPEGKLHYVSPSCERITGYSAAEFYNNPELIHSLIIPEDLNIFKNHKSETNNSNDHFTIEFRIKTKNGEIKWINHSCAPVFGPDGKLGGRQSSNREITELKHAREAIIDSEKRYRELFNSNPNPMWVYDLETLQFLEVNKTAELNYGYSRDEFLKLSLKDIRPKEEIEKLIRNIEQDRKDFSIRANGNTSGKTGPFSMWILHRT